MAPDPDARTRLRATFPSGAYVNLIHESGGEVFPDRIPVPDIAKFVLEAPCDGTFFLGIYSQRRHGEPDWVVYLAQRAEKGQPIQFG